MRFSNAYWTVLIFLLTVVGTCRSRSVTHDDPPVVEMNETFFPGLTLDYRDDLKFDLLRRFLDEEQGEFESEEDVATRLLQEERESCLEEPIEFATQKRLMKQLCHDKRIQRRGRARQGRVFTYHNGGEGETLNAESPDIVFLEPSESDLRGALPQLKPDELSNTQEKIEALEDSFKHPRLGSLPSDMVRRFLSLSETRRPPLPTPVAEKSPHWPTEEDKHNFLLHHLLQNSKVISPEDLKFIFGESGVDLENDEPALPLDEEVTPVNFEEDLLPVYFEEELPKDYYEEELPEEYFEEELPKDYFQEELIEDYFQDELHKDYFEEELIEDYFQEELPKDYSEEELPNDYLQEELPEDYFKEELLKDYFEEELPTDYIQEKLPEAYFKEELLKDFFEEELPIDYLQETLPEDYFKEELLTDYFEEELPKDYLQEKLPEDYFDEELPQEYFGEELSEENFEDDLPEMYFDVENYGGQDHLPTENFTGDLPSEQLEIDVRTNTDDSLKDEQDWEGDYEYNV